MTSKPNRLHIAAIIMFGFKVLKEMLFVLFAFIFIGTEDLLPPYILNSAVLIIIITLGLISWLRWFRFTYSVEGADLKIEHGVFIRKKRTISKYRIQSINLNQNLLHRVLGLTGLQIETAGSDLEVDANLLALKLSVAEDLRNQLKTSDDTDHGVDEYDYDFALENELPKYEASYKRLFAFGSTSGGFSLIFVGIIFVLSEAINFVPEDIYDQTTTWILDQAIMTTIILAFLIVSVIWFVGVFSSVIKYGDFTIIRHDQELYIKRGLLEKKQLTIPLKRIQAVSFKQNILRLPFKFGSLTIVIAGGEVSQKEQTQTIIFPLIKQSEINPFLAKILPEYHYRFDQLKPITKKYFYFNSSIALIFTLIITTILAIFVSKLWWIGLVPLILGSCYEFISYRLTKTDLTEEQLTIQIFPTLSKETICIKKDQIQALEQRQSLLQKKLGIANYKVSVLDNFLGQHYSIKGLSTEDGEEISDWYSYQDAYKLEDLELSNKLT